MFGRTSRPYAGGTGSSGSQASHERREDEDESGISTFRHTMVLGHLQQAGQVGLTWFELQERLGGDWHHGSVTGALSAMHKNKMIARLTERRANPRALIVEDLEEGVRRGTSSVYVALEHVAGRPTAIQGRKFSNRLAEQVEDLEARLAKVDAGLRDAILQVTPLEIDNDRLRSEVDRLERHNTGLKAEVEGWMKRAERAEAKVLEQAARIDNDDREKHRVLEILDQEVAAAQERQGRMRDEHAAQVSKLVAEVARANDTNSALRIQRWLHSLEAEEQEVLDKILFGLNNKADAPDNEVAPVSLGALRIMTTALSRLERKPRHA